MLELAVGIHEDNFIFRFLETYLTTFRKVITFSFYYLFYFIVLFY